MSRAAPAILHRRGCIYRRLAQGVPNYPNYRLGALTNSQCDSLDRPYRVQRAAKEQILKIYPNPATDYTIIDYGFTDWNKGPVSLEICNALGQVIYTATITHVQRLPKN